MNVLSLYLHVNANAVPLYVCSLQTGCQVWVIPRFAFERPARRSKANLGRACLQAIMCATPTVAGFPVWSMYFSRHLVPAFKSRDLFVVVCMRFTRSNDE